MKVLQSFLVWSLIVGSSLLGGGGIRLAEAKINGFDSLQPQNVSGVFLDVPLREVLTQLHQELGIESVVAEEELNTPISFVGSGLSLVEALSKILVHWDYVLQKGHTGAVVRIFVVKREATQSLIYGVDLQDGGRAVPQSVSSGHSQPAKASTLADGKRNLLEEEEMVMAVTPDDGAFATDRLNGPGGFSKPARRATLDSRALMGLDELSPEEIPVPPSVAESLVVSPDMVPEAMNAPPMEIFWP